MTRKSVLLKYAVSLFLIFIGVIVGIIIHSYWRLPIDETINLVDLITLVATIFLAVYIPEVLDRKLQISRDKKHLIELRIEDLQSLYRRINILVQSEDVIKPDHVLIIKNLLDISGHRLDTVITLFKYSNMKASFDEEIKQIAKLSEEHRQLLWREIPENDVVNYPPDIKEKEEILYNDLDKITCLLIFRINEV